MTIDLQSIDRKRFGLISVIGLMLFTLNVSAQKSVGIKGYAGFPAGVNIQRLTPYVNNVQFQKQTALKDDESFVDKTFNLRINPKTGQTNNILYSTNWTRVIGIVTRIGPYEKECFEKIKKEFGDTILITIENQRGGNPKSEALRHEIHIINHPWLKHGTIKVGDKIDIHGIRYFKHEFWSGGYYTESISSGGIEWKILHKTDGGGYFEEYYDFGIPVK